MNLSAALQEELVQHREVFENELFSILSYWAKYAPNKETGGFHGAVDLKNTAVPDVPVTCVLITRILYTFSTAAKAYPERGYEEMAHKAYHFLEKNFRDDEYDGYFMEVTPAGEPSNTIKHTYSQGFVLYALAAYYMMTGDELILNRIIEFFKLLLAKTKDQGGPGYWEAFNKDWTIHSDNRMADDNDPKSMNTHLHLLEGFAAVYQVYPDDTVKRPLKDLLMIFQKSIIRRNGHLGIFFDREFNETEKSKAICSFGHDIESSWLLLEATEILGDWEVKDLMEPQLIQMAKNVFRKGMDQDGGLFLESTRYGSHLRTNKHWWLQAEMLVGEMNSFQKSGAVQYWNLLKKTWSFINKWLIDHENGEWFTKVNRMGRAYLVEPENDPSPYYRNDWKIDPWKCPYHNGRAMMELIKRINKTLG